MYAVEYALDGTPIPDSYSTVLPTTPTGRRCRWAQSLNRTRLVQWSRQAARAAADVRTCVGARDMHPKQGLQQLPFVGR